jgi:hypothetical protein
MNSLPKNSSGISYDIHMYISSVDMIAIIRTVTTPGKLNIQQ